MHYEAYGIDFRWNKFEIKARAKDGARLSLEEDFSVGWKLSEDAYTCYKVKEKTRGVVSHLEPDSDDETMVDQSHRFLAKAGKFWKLQETFDN